MDAVDAEVAQGKEQVITHPYCRIINLQRS
jgi:hypothetical protein